MLRRTGVLLFALVLLCGACSGTDRAQRVSTVATKLKAPDIATTTTGAAPDTTAAAAAPVRHIQRVRTLPGETGPRAPRVAAYRGPTPTGRIEIPRIGLDHLTYEGLDLEIIDYGPSHWPGTALPGQTGNTVFPGHRVTHSHPFLNIDLIQIGDNVTFVNSSGRYTYEVTDTFVVNADETWIADPTPTPTMTIFGCHPKHSAKQRYVVKGKLVRTEKIHDPSQPTASSPNTNDDGSYSTAPDPSQPEPTTTTTEPRKGIVGIIG